MTTPCKAFYKVFSMPHWQIWLEEPNYVCLNGHTINRRMPIWSFLFSSAGLVFPPAAAIEDVCILDSSTGKQEGIWTLMTCCCTSGFDVLPWPPRWQWECRGQACFLYWRQRKWQSRVWRSAVVVSLRVLVFGRAFWGNTHNGFDCPQN